MSGGSQPNQPQQRVGVVRSELRGFAVGRGFHSLVLGEGGGGEFGEGSLQFGHLGRTDV